MICARKEFLRNFNPVQQSDWIEIVPGRVACLRLSGKMGALHIFVAYLSAGSDTSKKAERLEQLDLLGEVVAGKDEELTIIAGDFNFVEVQGDRKAKTIHISRTSSGQGGNTVDDQSPTGTEGLSGIGTARVYSRKRSGLFSA